MMRLCVALFKQLRLTETFIHAHIRGLPADVSVILGVPPRLDGPVPKRPSLPYRVVNKVYRASGDEDRARTAEYEYLLRAARPDVVLAEYGQTGAWMSEACERLGIPLVVHFHGYDASREDVLSKYADAYARMFRSASSLVAVSRPMRDQLVSLGAPPEKVVVNPCSVDLTSFPPATPEEAPPTFLAVGRLVDKKAPHLLVLAFAKVHGLCPDAELRIVGDGPLAGPVSDLVQALHLEGAVRMLGPLPHDAVVQEIQRARAFVQHSVVAADGDSEGTPVSVLEAGASGVPIVSTSHAGIPDAVAHERTGYIVPERDVDGMAAYMLKLAEDPGLAGRLGAASRDRIGRLYDREYRIAKLAAVLEAAYAGRGVPSDLLHDPLDDVEEGVPVDEA